jgi:hypothetical protein
MFRIIHLFTKTCRKTALASTTKRYNATFVASDIVKDLEKRFKSAEIEDASTSAKYLVASLFNQTNLDKFEKEASNLSLDAEQVKAELS